MKSLKRKQYERYLKSCHSITRSYPGYFTEPRESEHSLTFEKMCAWICMSRFVLVLRMAWSHKALHSGSLSPVGCERLLSIRRSVFFFLFRAVRRPRRDMFGILENFRNEDFSCVSLWVCVYYKWFKKMILVCALIVWESLRKRNVLMYYDHNSDDGSWDRAVTQ